MAWNTIPELSNYTQLLTSRLLSQIVENLNERRTPAQYIYTRDPALGNKAVTNTTYADLDATFMKPTLVFTGNPIEVTFYVGNATAAVNLILTLTVDGSDIGVSTTGLAVWKTTDEHLFRYIISGVSAGSHTIALQTKNASAGTFTMVADRPIQFMVREM